MLRFIKENNFPFNPWLSKKKGILGSFDKALLDLIEIIHFTEKVSTKIHGLLDVKEIFRTVKNEFVNCKGYTVSILLLTDQGSKLRVAETSVSPKKIKMAEKFVGFILKDFRIDLSQSAVYKKVVKEGKTVQINSKELFYGSFSKAVARFVSKLLRARNKFCILTPLRKDKKVIGALTMSSSALVKYFAPSVRNLALHISNALEMAYENRKRQSIERVLRESKEKLRKIFISSPDAITVTDLKGNIIGCNEATLKMHGFDSKKELIGKSAFCLIDLRDHKRAREGMEKTSRRGFIRNVEFVFVSKDGRPFPAELSASVIKDSQGRPTSFVALTKDISERKQAERKVKEYSRKLEDKVKERTCQLIKANKLKSEFLADISHELRTPLSIIKTNLELLQKEGPDKEELLIIKKTVDRMTNLIAQLVTFSRIDSGEIKFIKKEINLNTLLQDIILKFYPLAQKRNVKMKVSSSKIVKVQADREALETAISNLISNAIRYNKRNGEVGVDLTCQDRKVTISVSDTGAGIVKEELDHIFERFYRVEKSRSREKGGEGLGLAITKEIVNAHKGEIKIESVKGKGSKFTLLLPR